MRWIKIAIFGLAVPLLMVVVILASVLIGPARIESAAIWLDPKKPTHYYSRGMAYEHAGRYGEALADFDTAIQLDDKYTAAYNDDAWLLATCPQAEFRDGKNAVKLATKAVELSAGNDPGALDTLAVAYAEAGDFDQAVKWETKCKDSPYLGEDRADEVKDRLALFESQKPYHVERY
jgi:tetratricopeptide (TPR) repeat protein